MSGSRPMTLSGNLADRIALRDLARDANAKNMLASAASDRLREECRLIAWLDVRTFACWEVLLTLSELETLQTVTDPPPWAKEYEPGFAVPRVAMEMLNTLAERLYSQLMADAYKNTEPDPE